MPTPMLALPLVTPRLVLRAFVADDLPAMSNYARDEEVLRHVLHEPRNQGELGGHLDHLLAAEAGRARRAWELAVQVARTRRVIGSCDLELTGPGVADLGYLLARRHWGHGYGSELAQSLVEAAFLQLRVQRVQAIVEVHNERSRRVLANAGLRWEGLLRRHAHAKGRWWDCHLYVITRAQWAARAGAGVRTAV